MQELTLNAYLAHKSGRAYVSVPNIMLETEILICPLSVLSSTTIRGIDTVGSTLCIMANSYLHGYL